MQSIDGAEGGGQMLRTALALAACTATPVEITAIRGERPTPGLQAQHLAAVELVASVCDADVRGAELGSEALEFRPGDEWATTQSVDVGTAGSLTLLFDTVLPLATVVDEQIVATATGGTDVKWSPAIDYYRRVKLPLLARAGLAATVTVDRTGFYPAGGGNATLTASLCELTPLTLDQRGELAGVAIYSKASDDLESASVAERQASHAADRLAEENLPVVEQSAEYVPTHSPGSVIVLAGRYDHTTLGVDTLGERGVPSESVADDAVDQFLRLHDAGSVVDPQMGDQLMVMLALAGGTVRIPRVTPHIETNLSVIEKFGLPLSLSEDEAGYRLHAPHQSQR